MSNVEAVKDHNYKKYCYAYCLCWLRPQGEGTERSLNQVVLIGRAGNHPVMRGSADKPVTVFRSEHWGGCGTVQIIIISLFFMSLWDLKPN